MRKMKLFYGILIGFLLLSACSSDDDSSNPESPTLAGAWKQINEIDYCSTGTQEIINSSTCEQNGKFNFNSNGTYNITYYELVGNDCNLDYTENGNWETNNGSLIITNQDGSFEFTTFELTENTLKLGREEIDQGEPCNNGHLISYELNFVRAE